MTCLTPEAINAYAKISMKERQAAATPARGFSKVRRPKWELNLGRLYGKWRQATPVLPAERAYDAR